LERPDGQINLLSGFFAIHFNMAEAPAGGPAWITHATFKSKPLETA